MKTLATHREPPPSNGAGTTGLTFGVVTAVLCWVPVLGFLLGLVAITLGSVGLHQARQGWATNSVASGWAIGLGLTGIMFYPLLFA